MVEIAGHKIIGTGRRMGVRTILFVCVVSLWLILDMLSKAQFDEMEPGGIIAGPFLGIFDFRLVHNTGGAWGIFAGNPIALGVFSILVVVALVVFFFIELKGISIASTIGLALIVAGGIGNAIDRFVQGYVIDFIEFSFFDFPVFNIADIGVTCGFVILLIGVFFFDNRQRAS